MDARNRPGVLANTPPPQFLELLRARGVKDLSAGQVIVSTQEPFEQVMLLAIRNLGLELQVIFNKGAVMALPSGVNKATGLHAARAAMKLSPHNVIGVGDAENDHAFLEICECAVAVANALPAIRAKANFVIAGNHGFGVTEIIDALIATDLAELSARLTRHDVVLGRTIDGTEFHLAAHGPNVLVAGTSGGGKSTLISGLIERLLAQQYQTLIIDPEGDYPEIEGTLILGTGQQSPSLEEIMGALEKPARTVVANLISIPLEDRPAFLQALLHRLVELRTRTGRPHRIVVDEAHHILPASTERDAVEIPASLHSLVLVTVEPRHLNPAVLRRVDLLLVVGASPQDTIRDFCIATTSTPPRIELRDLPKGQIVARRPGGEPVVFETMPGRSSRRRHVRKYARDELNENDSFYFRGAEGKLRLRAHNLQTFVRLAEGVGDDTWQFHLREGASSHCIKTVLEDADLAEAVARIENDRSLSAAQSRGGVRREIEARHTAPA